MTIASPHRAPVHAALLTPLPEALAAFILVIGLALAGCPKPADTGSTERSGSESGERPSEPAAPADPAKPDVAAAPSYSSSWFDFTAEGSCKSALSAGEEKEAIEHGSDVPVICPDAVAGHDAKISWVGAAGHRVVELVARDGGWASDLSVCGGEHGKKLEVRSADGVPFAVILRQTCMTWGDDGPVETGQHLVVRGLAGFESIAGSVDVRATAAANEAAQQLADAGHAAAAGAEGSAAGNSAASKNAAGNNASAGPTTHIRGEGHAGLHSALDAAGACKDAGEPFAQALVWTLDDGRSLYAAVCENFAYQSTYQWWARGADGAFVQVTDSGDSGESTAAGAGYPEFDPKTQRATRFAKARGLGDCGDYYVHSLSGAAWTLVEHRSRACDDETAEQAGEPSKWPLKKR